MTFLISCFRLLLLYILTPDPDLAQQQQLDYAAIYAPCLLNSIIYRCHDRILIGQLDLCHAVDLVNAFQTGFLRPRSNRNRLSAPCNASSLACHHFYKVIMHFSVFHPIQQFFGAMQSITTAIFTSRPFRSTDASLIPSTPRIPVN